MSRPLVVVVDTLVSNALCMIPVNAIGVPLPSLQIEFFYPSMSPSAVHSLLLYSMLSYPTSVTMRRVACSSSRSSRGGGVLTMFERK